MFNDKTIAVYRDSAYSKERIRAVPHKVWNCFANFAKLPQVVANEAQNTSSVSGSCYQPVEELNLDRG